MIHMSKCTCFAAVPPFGAAPPFPDSLDSIHASAIIPATFCSRKIMTAGRRKYYVWAQSTAQVSGAVTDQSGAVLPGVEVTMTQTETGLTRSMVTNETGSYAMTNLPVGPYRC